MSMETKKIGDIIQSYSEIGCDIQRQPRRFSFGTYDECRDLFINAFKAVDATVTNFVMLREYDDIIRWMTDTQGRGLLLAGGNGVGKSVIITGVIPVIFKYRFNMLVHPYRASELCDKENEILARPFICIDDMGIEPVKNLYGERHEVICNIFDNAENSLKPVFISTNMTGSQVRQRYGDRVTDRISRLCHMIRITSVNNSLRPSQR